MTNELYSVMVNSGGGLEFPLKQSFLENNNLVTKDEVSELVGDSGLVAYPKEVTGGETVYPNKVGSKGWYVNAVSISYNAFKGNAAVLQLSDTPAQTLSKISNSEIIEDGGSGLFTLIEDGQSLFTDGDGSIWGLYGDIKSGDRLTFIVQSAALSDTYESDCQLQAILKVIGYDNVSYGLVVELDTSAPYCDTVFKRQGTVPTLERIFNAWIKGYDNDAYNSDAVKATKPDGNTVRVYGKPELGVVDVLNSAYVMGINSEASGETAFAQGRSNKVTSTGSAAFGRNNTVPGYCSVAFGQENEVYGEKNFVSGMRNKTYGLYNAAFGVNNTVGDRADGSKQSNFVVGSEHKVSGYSSLVAGNNHTVSGAHNLIAGMNNNSTANRSFILGVNNIISSTGNFNLNTIIGVDNTASDNAAESLLIGTKNTTKYQKSYAIGTGLNVYNRDQMVVGYYNAGLSENVKFAVGTGSADNARKTGFYVTTTNAFVNDSPIVTEAGCNKLAVGNQNSNTKNYTFTVGNNITNNSENGFVAGKFNKNTTITQRDGEDVEIHYPSTNLLGEYLKQSPVRSSTVVGTYNDNSKPYLFSVGGGTSESNRKTIFGVKNDGNIDFDGDITLSDPNYGENYNPYKYIGNTTWAGKIEFFDSGASGDVGCAVSMANNDQNAVIGVATNYGLDGNSHVKIVAKDGLRIFDNWGSATSPGIGSGDFRADLTYSQTDNTFTIKTYNPYFEGDYIKIDTGNLQVPIFNEDGSRTDDFATIKVVRNSSGQLQLMLS